jgi:hypothetical protein
MVEIRGCDVASGFVSPEHVCAQGIFSARQQRKTQVKRPDYAGHPTNPDDFPDGIKARDASSLAL